MAWDGMLAPSVCKRCNKPLNADGGHPAELYAGTYNGLCYACTGSGEYSEGKQADGAETWNFPPHCPAWRRDRETFIGYAGCETCGGHGRIMHYRSYATGGPYPNQCELCSARYYAHPFRKWAGARWGRITRAAQAVYEAKLKAAKLYRLAKRGEAPKGQVAAIQEAVLTRFRHASARARVLIDQRRDAAGMNL
jgi:hypothetical protein